MIFTTILTTILITTNKDMNTLKELINYLNKRNIYNKLVNNQVIIKRSNYDVALITKLSENKNQIDSFYLDSTMIFYINNSIN